MLRASQLLLELGARELQRLTLAHFFRILLRPLAARSLALLFQFVHPFLESGIRINQSFASITHVVRPDLSQEGNSHYTGWRASEGRSARRQAWIDLPTGRRAGRRPA